MKNEIENDFGEISDLTPEKLTDIFFKKGLCLEKLGRKNKLFFRLRSPISASAMLVLCLMWGAGVYTLRELAALARVRNICRISDVALLKRIRKARRFVDAALQAYLTASIKDVAIPEGESLQLLCVDGTRGRDRLRGKAGKGFILHYGLRLEISDSISGRTEFAEFTSDIGKGNGESLARPNCHYRRGDIVLADRGYCKCRGLWAVLCAGADFIVRAHMSTIALAYSAAGDERISLAQTIRKMQLEEEESAETEIWMRMSMKHWEKIRVCVRRRNRVETAVAKEAYRKQIGKSTGRRKNPNISDDAMFLCGYIVLLTSLTKEEQFSLEDILKLYKIRWQVELTFKRFKSIGKLEVLPTSNVQSTEVFRTAKMLAFLLAEEEFGNLDVKIAQLENTGIDEDGIDPKQARPQDDHFWRNFKLGFQCITTRLNLIQKTPLEERKHFLQCLQRFDNRERNRKRKRAVSNLGWEIFSRNCA